MQPSCNGQYKLAIAEPSTWHSPINGPACETNPSGHAEAPIRLQRRQRALDDAAIPFDLNAAPESAVVLIYIEDESLPQALDLLQRAGFTVDICPQPVSRNSSRVLSHPLRLR